MRVIDFMGWRRIALAISVGFLLLSVASFFTRQLAWGLDFTGGTLVEVHFAETADLARVRTGLEQGGFSGAIVVAFGTDRDVLIRLPSGHTEMAGDAVLKLLRQDARSGVELRRTEFGARRLATNCASRGGWQCCWHLA